MAWSLLRANAFITAPTVFTDVFEDLRQKGAGSIFYNASLDRLGVYDFNPVLGFVAPTQAPAAMPPAVLLESGWYNSLENMQTDFDEVLGPYDQLRNELVGLQDE